MFHWYGFFIGLAIVVGWSVAERIEPRVSKVSPRIIVFGVLGARMWHVLDMWSYYQSHSMDIFKVWEGGMSIWGAIIGGILAVWIYFKGSTLKVMGAIVTALPLAQAIGRLGNAVNGEFSQRVWILPWWGAEAILDLVLFAVLWRPAMRGLSSQVKVGVYIVGYALIRLVLAPYRL